MYENLAGLCSIKRRLVSSRYKIISRVSARYTTTEQHSEYNSFYGHTGTQHRTGNYHYLARLCHII